MNPYLLIVIIIVIVTLGGGGAYLFYVLTRPKKQTWDVDVYQLLEGIRPPIRNNKGEVISDVPKQDMRPYTTDIIQRRETARGIVVYWLVKLGKPCPAITNDVVDIWPGGKKRVMALLYEDSITILRKGYDKDAGDALFDPVPYSRKMMIMAESQMRKERMENSKGLFEKIALYVTIGILCISLVAVAYFMGDSAIKVSDNNLEAAELYESKWPNAPGTPGAEEPKKEEPPPLIDAG